MGSGDDDERVCLDAGCGFIVSFVISCTIGDVDIVGVSFEQRFDTTLDQPRFILTARKPEYTEPRCSRYSLTRTILNLRLSLLVVTYPSN